MIGLLYIIFKGRNYLNNSKSVPPFTTNNRLYLVPPLRGAMIK